MSKLAVYFSQSWRPRDVELNVQIWNELSPTCELLVDVPEDASADPPYHINRIEELLRKADIFVAVLTHRPQKSGLQCSPYMLFEIRLAERMGIPRLVLYEDQTAFGPQASRRPECYVEFQRAAKESRIDRSSWQKEILPSINEWNQWCEKHLLPTGRERSTIALLLDVGEDAEASAAARSVLKRRYNVLPCNPAEQDSNEVFRAIRGAALVVAFDLTSALYAAAHMAGVPTIRLIRGEKGAELPWIVNVGAGGFEEDIVYWTDPASLTAQLEPRVKSMAKLSLAKQDGEAIEYLTSKRYRKFLVFVSHNLKPPDDQLVQIICGKLNSRNIPTFEYNQNNKTGIDWNAALEESLGKTTHMVALVSPTYDQSPACTKEIETALARGSEVEILPFKVLGRQIPHPRMTERHHEPLRSTDSSENAEQVYNQVVERLDAALAK
jgi:hypothetical protein